MAIRAKKQKTPTFSKVMNFGPHILTLLKALWQGYMTSKFCGPKFKNGGDMAMEVKKPHFLKFPLFETDEHWSTSHQKFVGHSSKTAEIWRWGGKLKTLTFSKLMNFGKHILTPFKSPKAGVQNTKNLWIIVQNGRDIAKGAKNRKPPLLKKLKFFA